MSISKALSRIKIHVGVHYNANSQRKFQPTQIFVWHSCHQSFSLALSHSLSMTTCYLSCGIIHSEFSFIKQVTFTFHHYLWFISNVLYLNFIIVSNYKINDDMNINLLQIDGMVSHQNFQVFHVQKNWHLSLNITIVPIFSDNLTRWL